MFVDLEPTSKEFKDIEAPLMFALNTKNNEGIYVLDGEDDRDLIVVTWVKAKYNDDNSINYEIGLSDGRVIGADSRRYN